MVTKSSFCTKQVQGAYFKNEFYKKKKKKKSLQINDRSDNHFAS